MSELFRRLRFLFNRRRLEDELDADLAFHREMAAAAEGRPVGDAVRIREEAREAWGWTWLDRLAQDVRYGLRTLRQSPGFSLVAILMLAIGIGVNVAAFGFFNAVLLTPLPISDPDSLLRLDRRSPRQYASELPYPEMAFLRDHATTLSAVLALHSTRLSAEGMDKPVNAHFVTENYFSELGGQALVGRTLDPLRDSATNASPVVVLSHGFWRRQFGDDHSVIGRTLQLNGKPATVVGVASSAFSGLTMSHPDLWLAVTAQPYFVSGSQLLTDMSVDSSGVKTWGRARPGIAPHAVEQELGALAATLRRDHPDDIWPDETIAARPGGYPSLGGGSHRSSGPPPPSKAYTLFGLVSTLTLLILSVACANLGGLLLARGVAREREIAIRAAVGAGSGRLVRQLFTESALLALLGAAAGIGLGYIVLRVLMLVTEGPAWLDIAPDWRVVAFALGMGMLSALVFGLAPALQIVRRRHRSTFMRQCLIGAQVAASCVLLIVSGLLVRALDRVSSSHHGFDYQQVVTIDPALASHGYNAGTAQAYLDTLRNRIRVLPGVEDVSMTTTPPLGGRTRVTRVDAGERALDVHLNSVDPAVFRTMRIPLLRGTALTAGDAKAVVVSESLALSRWPNEDPLGRRFDDATVVGVVGSARLTALQDPDAVEAYYLATPADLPMMVVMVKTSGPPEHVVPVVASVAKTVDPKVYPEVRLLKTSFRKKLRDAEVSALSVTVLGASALLLACLGIVGLVAFTVSQRTKEIGIRMALGASGSHVMAVVLRQLSRPLVLGLLAGIGGAAAASQVLRRELYGISNVDPVAYGAAVAVFLVTAAVTAMLPARRALRVDPLRALRYD